MTLLEKAKAAKRKNRLKVLENREGFDLAMAWARGEIGLLQVNTAIHSKRLDSANALYYLATAFRWGVQHGLLKEIHND